MQSQGRSCVNGVYLVLEGIPKQGTTVCGQCGCSRTDMDVDWAVIFGWRPTLSKKGNHRSVDRNTSANSDYYGLLIYRFNSHFPREWAASRL